MRRLGYYFFFLLLGAGLSLLIQVLFKSEKEVVAEIQPSSFNEDESNSLLLLSDVNNTLTTSERATIAIYQKRNPGVVNISTETVSYNWFFEPIPKRGTTGSGSIIDERGYVLTNDHVIEGATRIFITFSGGETREGSVMGSDPENDLAVLSFDPKGISFSIIPMGNSKPLQVGQKVFAIGNPFALDRTLTEGIVSGLGRPVRTDSNLVINNMIQTDASINPGNSGGPLLDSRGNMIGINTMIYTPSGGSVGVGFAVSIDTARRIIPDLVEYGFVKRGWIDIVPRQIFPRLAQYARLPVERGILVSEVISQGNADKAGIQGGKRAIKYGQTTIYLGGDIIVEIDGKLIESLANLFEALEDNRPGEEIDVVVVRPNGKKEALSLTLSERPKSIRWD